MQTHIHPNLIDLQPVKEANEILRACVHCGFCTAVCPTYQLLGDDLDSPRGRIYLIKNMLEEDGISPVMNEHLDRCLTCRSCETTCPSGVQYGRLLDIGKGLVTERYQPEVPLKQKVISAGLRFLLPKAWLFTPLFRLGQLCRPLLPTALRKKLIAPSSVSFSAPKPLDNPKGRVLLLQGCVQKAATPGVNQALAYLLGKQNIAVEYLEREGCCGALDYHLGAHEKALERVRYQIDQIHPRLEQLDCIISSASGCGVTIKEYPSMFSDDPVYKAKALALVEKEADVSEYLADFEFQCEPMAIAVHTPCTLQHGQKLPNTVTEILSRAGASLVEVEEKHLCCGSAGTYSVMQPAIANQLTERKIKHLQANKPDVIVTANVGCQMQLAAEAGVPVMHWVEFLARHG